MVRPAAGIGGRADLSMSSIDGTPSGIGGWGAGPVAGRGNTVPAANVRDDAVQGFSPMSMSSFDNRGGGRSPHPVGRMREDSDLHEESL